MLIAFQYVIAVYIIYHISDVESSKISYAVMLDPSTKTVDLHGSKRFKCKAYGDPVATISWQFNGMPIKESNQIHNVTLNGYSVLRVNDASPALAGYYCCSVFVDHRKESCGVLRVLYAPVIFAPPKNRTVEVNDRVLFHCSSSGYPKPEISWFHNGNPIHCSSNMSMHECGSYLLTMHGSLRISPTAEKDSGAYYCKAENKFGVELSSIIYLKVISQSTVISSTLSSTTHHVDTTELAVIYSSSMETKTSKADLPTGLSVKPPNEYHESLVDDNNAVLIVIFLGSAVLVAVILYVSCTAVKKNCLVKYSRRDSSSQKTLDGNRDVDKLSYPIEKLEVIEELGEGVFGLVFKARAPGLLSTEKVTMVAVKTVRLSDRGRIMEDFSREAELLATFNHQNIIQLLGVCFGESTQACGSRNISCLVFEYVDGGDLCAYLRAHGPHKSFFLTSESCERQHNISALDQIRMCENISCGMKYLSERNFIHRDLATRNCLVSESNQTIKIADFGLSRKTYESDYYKASEAESVPIRWMAPESILYGKYSTLSDVWAYGVTLWEVYSYALQPYFSMSNEEVICQVCQGNLLQPPPAVPIWMYKLMQLCWQKNPDDRPNFAMIHAVLDAILNNQGKLPLSDQDADESEYVSLLLSSSNQNRDAIFQSAFPPNTALSNSTSSSLYFDSGRESNV